MTIEFFQTPMGRTFFEGTVPQLVKTLGRIAEIMEKSAPKPAEAQPVDAQLLLCRDRLGDALERMDEMALRLAKANETVDRVAAALAQAHKLVAHWRAQDGFNAAEVDALAALLDKLKPSRSPALMQMCSTCEESSTLGDAGFIADHAAASCKIVQLSGADDVLAAFDDPPLAKPDDVDDPRCKTCGAYLMFSARARGDGLCGPCSREKLAADADAPDAADEGVDFEELAQDARDRLGRTLNAIRRILHLKMVDIDGRDVGPTPEVREQLEYAILAVADPDAPADGDLVAALEAEAAALRRTIQVIFAAASRGDRPNLRETVMRYAREALSGQGERAARLVESMRTSLETIADHGNPDIFADGPHVAPKLIDIARRALEETKE